MFGELLFFARTNDTRKVCACSTNWQMTVFSNKKYANRMISVAQILCYLNSTIEIEIRECE